jgi:GTPase
MASIFTYDPNPPRVSSPWSTPGRATPQPAGNESSSGQHIQQTLPDVSSSPIYLSETGITRLEPEPQEGATEYKLHLLLRPRRTFTSTSTSFQASGTQQSAYLSKAGSRSTTLTPFHPIQPPSTVSRQTRLQQLTTQLLWRLQQSSPFHSSSTANLILPNLPEATPRLGLPSKPATLLPGLEESQGALYEIGVSDDGTFVGLLEDELDESLTNLRAMSASLGCVVEVLRKVIVGQCEWSDVGQAVGTSPARIHTDNLWVAEALVRPDLGNFTGPSPTASASNVDPGVPYGTLNGHDVSQPQIVLSEVEQLRVSLTGATTSGKSSLLGTLTTSKLDNGRGKSRLNLLKHRHEIASGITSSVAQELLGYRKDPPTGISELAEQLPPAVINYASQNVSSWNDIHASAARLIFLSDSPGLPRYSKSTIRTLVSWKPNWTIICIAADCGDGDTTGASTTPILSGSTTAVAPIPPGSMSSSDAVFVHVELCLKLDLPIIVAVTKMDIATKSSLRQILSRLLSTLKAAGKRPVLLSTSDRQGQFPSDQAVSLLGISLADEEEVEKVMKMVSDLGTAVVPIVLTSAMTGQGVGQLHSLLSTIPILHETEGTAKAASAGMHLQNLDRMPSKIFQVDEVFAMPPSKVYSAGRNVDEADRGTVLCGYVASSSVFVGDKLTLGPFLAEINDHDTSQNNGLHRSISFPSSLIHGRQSSQHHFSKSIPAPETAPVGKGRTIVAAAMWQPVRVVSIRNLRLPTRSLLAGQVGTIGVEPISGIASTSCDLRRARKGMVLVLFENGEANAYRSFTASFPASDFKAPNSPPLILGGHATVYVNSIRAAVRVSSVALAENDSDMEMPSRDESGVFTFDGDEQSADDDQDIKIRFKFLSSVEWMRLGDRVLVVPNAAAIGPITGGSVAATGGLNGFVGTICDLNA